MARGRPDIANLDVRFPFFRWSGGNSGEPVPIPFRTRPLNSPAPMVLSLKAWKSRSLPGLPRTDETSHDDRYENPPRETAAGFLFLRRYRRPARSAEHAFQNELRSGQEHHKDNQFLEGIGRNGVAQLLTDEHSRHDGSRGEGRDQNIAPIKLAARSQR